MTRYLTVEEIARLLHVSPDTVRRWVQRQIIEVVRPGGRKRILISEESLAAFLLERTVPVFDDRRVRRSRVVSLT